MKCNIQHLKLLFQIGDDGGIGGECTCIQLIAITKEWSNYKPTVLIPLVLEKEKLKISVTSSDRHAICPKIYMDLISEYFFLQNSVNFGFDSKTNVSIKHLFCCKSSKLPPKIKIKIANVKTSTSTKKILMVMFLF